MGLFSSSSSSSTSVDQAPITATGGGLQASPAAIYVVSAAKKNSTTTLQNVVSAYAPIAYSFGDTAIKEQGMTARAQTSAVGNEGITGGLGGALAGIDWKWVAVAVIVAIVLRGWIK